MSGVRHLLAMTLLTGCASDTSWMGQSGIDIPDSVPIIENPAPDSARPAFALSTPLFRVGARNDSDMEQELWNIMSAIFTPDKQLIVSMHSGREVRVFDSTGYFASTIGGVGDGPGEFRSARGLNLGRGDTLFMLDGLGRVNAYLPSGAHVGTMTYGSNPWASCCFPDGAVMTRTPERRFGDAQWPARRARSAYAVVTRASRGTATVLNLEDNDRTIRVGPYVRRVQLSNGSIHEVTGTVGMAPPFGRVAWIRIAGDAIIYGNGDAYEYMVFGRDGSMRRVVRAAATPRVPTDAELQVETDRFMLQDSSLSYQAAASAALKRVTTFHATMPAYGRISADESGAVWIRNYYGPADSMQWWARFSSEGRLEGTMVLPLNYHPISFSSGHVVVRHPDDQDGFTGISVFRLETVERR